MNLLRIVFIGCVLATICRADEFRLKDAQGKEYGPFEMRQGAKVLVGDQKLEIVTVSTPRDAVIQAMKRIVIPEIEFQNTSIQDAIAFLVKAGRDNDPEKQGVNIICLPLDGTTNTVAASRIVTKVSLSSRKVTLYSVVKLLRQITGLKVRVDDAGVQLMLPDEPEGVILYKAFWIEPIFPERVLESGGIISDPPGADEASLKGYFASKGITWPRGSSIRYVSSWGKAFVANTAENLARFEVQLAELYCVIRQVEIEAQFVRFEVTNLARVVHGNVDSKVIMALWTNGCGRVLAAPRVLTRSGTEASIRGVTEVIYPTSYDHGGGGNTNTNGVVETVVAPSDFATREVGAILTVLPEVSPDGSRMNLTLTPSFVDPPTWRDFSRDATAVTSKTRFVPAEQPYFHVVTCTTQIEMEDGATVLVGGGVPTGDEKGLVYCFVTARLLGIDGERRKKPVETKAVDLCDF